MSNKPFNLIINSYKKQDTENENLSPTIKIHAEPQIIRNILTDGEGYPTWDPGMDHIEGNLTLGDKIKYFTKISPVQAFPVKVTTFEFGERMVLSGGMPMGLFKSERTHILTSEKNGQTTFTTEETFSGLLLPLFDKEIPDLTENFEAFVAGLKQQAEK